MKGEDKIKPVILESIVIICIMAIYIAYGVNFPPLLIFIPVPFVILGIRHDIRTNIVSLVLTLLIVQILLSSTSGATLLLAFGPLSFMINYCIKKRKSLSETLLFSTMAFLISFVVLILLGGEIADMLKEAEVGFNQYLNFQLESIKEMGLTDFNVLQTKYELQTLYKEILVLTPSLLSIFSLFIAYVNIAISTWGIRKMGYGVVSKGTFSRFKLPNNIIPGIALMLVTGYVFRILNINYHEAFLLNVSFLFGFIFLVQGLAVIDFFLKKTKANLLLRIVVLSFLLLFIPAGSIILFIGLFDSIFDIRKIRRKKS